MKHGGLRADASNAGARLSLSAAFVN